MESKTKLWGYVRSQQPCAKSAGVIRFKSGHALVDKRA